MPSAEPGLPTTTADGVPLAIALSRSRRRARRQALLLVLPLLLFVLVTFIVPIGQMLHRSVYNPGFAGNMPQVSAWFAANPQGADPDEAAFAALAADLRRLVREEVKVGKSDDEVRKHLTDRYGEFVLLKPTFSWGNAALWGGSSATPLSLVRRYRLAELSRG